MGDTRGVHSHGWGQQWPAGGPQRSEVMSRGDVDPPVLEARGSKAGPGAGGGGGREALGSQTSQALLWL